MRLLSEVLLALDNEREYQRRRWGRRQPNGSFKETFHTLGNWLTFMQHYARIADAEITGNSSDLIALEPLRKVVTMGVACLEQRGIKSVYPDMAAMPAAKSVGDFLTSIRYLLRKGDEEMFVAVDTTSHARGLRVIKRVIYYGVACFMVHGVPSRDLKVSILNGHDGLPA